ncbi:MAG TPA: F0F1 ATP synthase subunit delta [Rhodospirillaceae bacterium]|nr:F0F1 ATP synthase subunit delta [Rhodospirillaceae bacterium]
MTTAPRASSVVATRYAAALIDLAVEGKLSDKIEKDLQALGAMIAGSEDLQTAIRSPLVGKDEQGKAMAALAKKAGFQALTQNFLGVLVNNGRLNALESVIEAAAREFSRRRGEVSAEVKTAAPLSASQTESLQKSISGAVGANVSLDVKVDPAILGGLVVTIGSRMIDDSVRRKLSRLRTAMGGQANENFISKMEEVG